MVLLRNFIIISLGIFFPRSCNLFTSSSVKDYRTKFFRLILF